MVCDRCKMVVDKELRDFGLLPLEVDLGVVTLAESEIDAVKDSLIARLSALGFEWIDDRKAKLVEQIKAIVIAFVKEIENGNKINFSHFLEQKIPLEYNYLSNVFKEVEQNTIEKYLILQKTERVKELLLIDGMQLNEIAYVLNYSSVAYLSNQFKKVTGLTPSNFKKEGVKGRKSLDTL